MPENPELVVPEQRGEFVKGIKREKGERILWVKEGNLLKYIRVKSGLATGNASEIISDCIKEGDLVVNGQTEKTLKKNANSAKSDGRSPFMPKMPSRNRNSAKGR